MDPRVDKQKILILHASAGHGHQKAAQAIEEACREFYPEADVQVRDTLEFTSPFFGNFYKEFYLFQIKYIPWLWGLFYYALDIPLIYFSIKIIRRLMNAVSFGRLAKYMIAENPSVIVATHFMPVEVASFLKKRGTLNAKLVTVVTDYLPHFVWMADGVDAYIVASHEAQEELARRGVPREKIRVLGIPIGKKFWKSAPAKTPADLGLKAGVFTVLVTSGGGGIGGIGRIAEQLAVLKKSIQILVVCGTNLELQKRLEAEASHNPWIRVYGFVNNMNELMTVSDLVVGKGGGLTITESFSKGKPVILFRPVPGQEVRNADLVKKYNAGFVTGSADEAVKKVIEIFENQALYQSLCAGAKTFSRPSAAEAIVHFLRYELS